MLFDYMSPHAEIPAFSSKKEKSEPKRHLGCSCTEPFIYYAFQRYLVCVFSFKMTRIRSFFPEDTCEGPA